MCNYFHDKNKTNLELKKKKFAIADDSLSYVLQKNWKKTIRSNS